MIRQRNRTRSQNELLVLRLLDSLASGHTIKTLVVAYDLPYNTIRSLFSRYKRRHGFRSTFQMVAVRAITRENGREKTGRTK